MTQTRTWAVGDRVVHSGRPEWGAGAITTALKTTQDGHPCQMLTIRFDRAGIKTISTAFATLIPADSAPSLPPEMPAADAAPSRMERSGSKFRIHDDAAAVALEDKLSGAADIRERMTKLPDAATDPFSGPISRLKATLDLFKHKPQGGALLDWAAAQSGLADPLSRFNRHELEQFFSAFVVSRDAHARKVIAEMRKSDPAALQQAVAACPPATQQALRRLDAGR